MKATEVIGGVVGAVILFNVLGAMTGSHETALSVLENVTDTTPRQPQQPATTPGTYGLNYVHQMTDAAYQNEMGFNRYYKGHAFDAVMTFKASHDHPILGGGYSVSFDSADCDNVSDPTTTNMIAGWQRGQLARVTGVIETVTLNTLILTRCRISPA